MSDGAEAFARGILRERLRLATAQLGSSTPYSDDLVVQDVEHRPGAHRLFQDYRGDLSGRYLGAVAVAYRERLPVDLDKAHRILDRVIAAQNPDGSFGSPALPALARDHGAAWGHGRLLDGLLSSASWVSAERADRLGDAIDRLAGHAVASAAGWVDWLSREPSRKFLLDPLSLVRPLARFAALRGDDRAMDAARRLVEAAPAIVDRLHLHGYLLFLRGRLEVAVARDDCSEVDAVCKQADEVAARFLLPSGSALESLSTPWDINTEGCGTADWVMLCLELAEATGLDRFRERAWLAGLNGLAHAQQASGHFGCETLVGDGPLLALDYAPEAWWCCTFHGIEALGALSRSLARVDASGGLVVNQPLDAVVESADGDVLLEVAGGYPFGDRVELRAGAALPQGSGLRLRIPESVTVSFSTGRLEAGWLILDALDPNSVVVVEVSPALWFDVAGTASTPPFGNTTSGAPELGETRVTLFLGQLAYAANAHENDAEDLVRARTLVLDPSHPVLQRGDATGEYAVRVAGRNEFGTTVRLAPLVTSELARNSRMTRLGFAGIVAEHSGAHA
ncbi:hypothetical protein [Agreia sp. Leaf283]|uniref:hypothetical protein n=1 Tax=Agreia sp. Leaf283 TaxID=1736321 RepID=UPI0006FDBE7B|nr:hypothetical protein [Agreia sp. Leaf283]KQP56903.1 hypothetical protein ASF51_03155 [Agreia sp. Leaf283]